MTPLNRKIDGQKFARMKEPGIIWLRGSSLFIITHGTDVTESHVRGRTVIYR